MDSDLPEGCPLSVQGHTFLLSVKRKFFIGLDNISGGPPENDRMRNGAATVSVYWRIWRRRESFMTPAHVSSVGPTQTVCGALKGLCAQILLFIGLRVARNLHCASFLLSIESQVQQTQSHHTHIICLPNADLSLEAVDWYVALITPIQSFSYDLIGAPQQSTGRGGTGNLRAPSVDLPRVAGPDDYSDSRGRDPQRYRDEVRNVSLIFPSHASELTYLNPKDVIISTGRGGAGNIRSPSRDGSRGENASVNSSPSRAEFIRGREVERDLISSIDVAHDTGIVSATVFDLFEK